MNPYREYVEVKEKVIDFVYFLICPYCDSIKLLREITCWSALHENYQACSTGIINTHIHYLCKSCNKRFIVMLSHYLESKDEYLTLL